MASEPSDRPKFIVGLGNPGRRYRGTRHNLGFEVLDRLARRFAADGPQERFDGLLWQARLEAPGRPGPAGQKVALLAPQTYMNNSGRSVAAMARFYKAEPEEILVVLDDLNLPAGMVRARAAGSAGGQKGLADILRALGTETLPRLRVGIGPPPGPMDAADYVLKKIDDEDQRALLNQAVETAAEAGETWVFGGIRRVMDTYNRKANQP